MYPPLPGINIFLLGSIAVGKLRGNELKEEKNFDGILQIADETSSQYLRSFVFTVQLENAVIFSMWDTATKLLVEAGDVRSVLVGVVIGVRFSVLEALVSIKTAQASTTWWNRKKLSIKALSSVNLIRKWVKSGNVNLVHNLHLLEAELANLNGYDRLAEDNYELAITTASANSFRQDKALSHELASMYYGSRGDVYKRDHHMKHAILCYEEWGAQAKVDQLKKRCWAARQYAATSAGTKYQQDEQRNEISTHIPTNHQLMQQSS